MLDMVEQFIEGGIKIAILSFALLVLVIAGLVVYIAEIKHDQKTTEASAYMVDDEAPLLLVREAGYIHGEVKAHHPETVKYGCGVTDIDAVEVSAFHPNKSYSHFVICCQHVSVDATDTDACRFRDEHHSTNM